VDGVGEQGVGLGEEAGQGVGVAAESPGRNIDRVFRA